VNGHSGTFIEKPNNEVRLKKTFRPNRFKSIKANATTDKINKKLPKIPQIYISKNASNTLSDLARYLRRYRELSIISSKPKTKR
jgi:hypothetical protein